MAPIRGAGHFCRRDEPAILASVVLLVAWNVGLMVLPPKQPIREAVEHLRASVIADGRAWSIGFGEDAATFNSEGRGATLVLVPRLGAVPMPPESRSAPMPRSCGIRISLLLRFAIGFRIPASGQPRDSPAGPSNRRDDPDSLDAAR